MLPVLTFDEIIGRRRRQRRSVRFQLHRQFRRPDPERIVVVVPDLLNGDVYRLRRVRYYDRAVLARHARRRVRHRVAFRYRILFHRVRELRHRGPVHAVHCLIGPRILPAVVRVQRLRVYQRLGAAAKLLVQLHLHARRLERRRRRRPDLLHADVYLLRRVRDRDKTVRIEYAARRAVRLRVPRGLRGLFHGIFDLDRSVTALFVLRQVLPRIAPGIRRVVGVQRHRLAIRCLIAAANLLIQLHRHAGRLDVGLTRSRPFLHDLEIHRRHVLPGDHNSAQVGGGRHADSQVGGSAVYRSLPLLRSGVVCDLDGSIVKYVGTGDVCLLEIIGLLFINAVEANQTVVVISGHRICQGLSHGRVGVHCSRRCAAGVAVQHELRARDLRASYADLLDFQGGRQNIGVDEVVGAGETFLDGPYMVINLK